SPGSGSGWWGGLWNTASTAIKTAEGVYKDLQASDEPRKWTTHVLHNVSTVQQKIGGELRSRALPTLSNLLHTIAPPIASHEQLRIHITHDIANYPSIDTIVYGVFDRVMQQVEGGDLLVVQRGRESKPRSSLGSGWASGPWYKGSEPRALNPCFGGIEEGCKLARAAAESYAHEFLQKQQDSDRQPLNPQNPTRKSDIFLAIQPTTHPAPSYLLPSPPTAEPSQISDPDETPDQLTTFALHLLDPIHQISFSTISQSVPAKWLEWIDSPYVPDDIAEILNAGGVDPREWVVEWVEETLGLAVGIVAQRYVAKRMNVGEGYTPGGKGKEREGGGGEEARAVGM
ncbi:maintenance of telomere capping protein 1, partial [Kalaharituber pfeilii]